MIDDLKNLWSNERCFIIGCGSSLLDYDPEKLRPFNSIGINYSYLWHDGSKFLTAQDRANLLEHRDYFSQTDSFVVTPASTIGLTFKHLVALKTRAIDDISFDLTDGVWQSETGSLLALQLALWLGANPIYFLGHELTTRTGRWRFHDSYRAFVPIHPARLEKIKRQFHRSLHLIGRTLPHTWICEINNRITDMPLDNVLYESATK